MGLIRTAILLIVVTMSCAFAQGPVCPPKCDNATVIRNAAPTPLLDQIPIIRWEYKIVFRRVSPEPHEEHWQCDNGWDQGFVELNKLGADGWELVAATQHGDGVRYILKRRSAGR